MSHDPQAQAVPRPVAPDHPEAHARDVVEAMRDRGTLTPDIERALNGAGRQHARFLNRNGMSPDCSAKPAEV